MSKWKTTSKHWSKTDKRQEVLDKIKKNLRPDYWTGKKRDKKTIKALNDGRTKWIVENPEKWKESRRKSALKTSGKTNGNWTGGKLKWVRKQVHIRDDYTCQVCGLRDIEIMDVDHIIPKNISPDLVYEMSNLITLCPNCHRRKTLREYKKRVYTHLI